MIRFLKVMVALMVAMFAVPALAFNPPPPPAVGSIVDQVGVLQPDAIRRLNMQLRQVNQSTSNQIGILIIPSPNGENMRDIGYATGKAWKVGQAGIDNGIMIVWARHNDQGGPGQITIETGKGVEGDLPDLKCNDIIRNVIGPKFKATYPGHFYDGLSLGISAINGAIGDHRAALAAQREKENNLRQSAARNDNGSPPVAASPRTSTPSSGGCDVSGAPMQQAGFGSALFWVAFFMGAIWLVRRQARKMADQSRQQEELQRKMREAVRQSEEQRQAEENTRLETLNARLRAEREAQEAREMAARARPAPVVFSAPTGLQGPVIVPTPAPVVHHDPVATVSAVSPTWEVAQRIRQEQEAARLREREVEEQRQAELSAERLRLAADRAERARQEQADEFRRQERLARARQEQEDREAAEAVAAAAAIAAAAVIISSGDNDGGGSSGSACSSTSSCSSSGSSCSSSSDNSSSCSSSSGGGDIGGGGSDGGACSS